MHQIMLSILCMAYDKNIRAKSPLHRTTQHKHNGRKEPATAFMLVTLHDIRTATAEYYFC
jgi:hypothetical protein